MIILLGRDLYMHTNRVKLSSQQLFITIKRKGVLKLHSYKSESHLSKDYPCQAWFHLAKITRNVCITKYACLYKLSNGIMVMTPK